jgi:hypothetical protein
VVISLLTATLSRHFGGMELSLESTVSFINASLAPAVIFTGVGLLLAGLQAKYSVLVATIRQLHEEGEEKLSDNRRYLLVSQVASLMRRARLVRNSICGFYLTIFFLILASLGLGLPYLGLAVPTMAPLLAFALALATLFLGIGIATWEAVLSFQIVRMEARRWTE